MFTNPVHPSPFADPFVLRHEGRYFAYGTPPSAGHVPVLVSDDLVRWEEGGDALRLTGEEADHFVWAPEVAFADGAFWMYFSDGGGDGAGHRLRVARSQSPTGPFEPLQGYLVADQGFTIDAHPFQDPADGAWYLYYCRDFVDGDGFVGTGIVVDRLEAMDRLAGDPREVVRPHADWHIFERGRDWGGQVQDWYTIEGAFTVVRDGRYWCFFSGGAWQEANYGVSSAVADHPLGPYMPTVTDQGADVLRSAPSVTGPGHASIAIAPDGETQYIVYHAWDDDRTGRRMHIDRLQWSEDGTPARSGPSTEAQPEPPRAHAAAT